MSTQTDTATGFRARIANQPRPALVWLGVLAVLLALEAGALLQFLGVFVAGVLEALPIWGDTAPAALASFIDATGKIPTLLSRETIPNAGYWNGQQYVGTFMGLAPHQAWALRAVLVYLYAFVTAAWLWVGYETTSSTGFATTTGVSSG
jgi:peptide/nickel transport system permease protein